MVIISVTDTGIGIQEDKQMAMLKLFGRQMGVHPENMAVQV